VNPKNLSDFGEFKDVLLAAESAREFDLKTHEKSSLHIVFAIK